MASLLRLGLICCLSELPLSVTFDDANMNGEYVLSQTPGAKDTQKLFPTEYKKYPGGVSHFDVYSPPIRSLYSQVFWKGLDPVDLPEDVVKRFDGKGMAVVGFELDQVRRTKDGDIQVPMSVSYNHHFESTMVGKHAAFEQVDRNTVDMNDKRIKHMNMGHGIPDGNLWLVKDRGTSSTKLPTSQDFGGANGGEVRKSFHGYAPGYAQLIDSPTQFQITPMQIDTWHREQMNVSFPTRFVSGPVPRTSLAPTTGPDALYSGLLECPVTTRIHKNVKTQYVIQVADTTCGGEPGTAEECYKAAQSALQGQGCNFSYATGGDEDKPPGCSAASGTTPGLVHVYFRTSKESRRAGALKTVSGRRGFFNRTLGGHCGAHATQFAGHSQPLVKLSIELDTTKQQAQLTLTGPSDVWFGMGFGAKFMEQGPWTVIVDGKGGVTERKLGSHQPGRELAASIAVKESSINGTLRTVVLTRALQGAGPEYYTFDPVEDGAIDFISAVGSTVELSYHKEHVVGTLSLLPIAGSGPESAACVCKTAAKPFGQAEGSLEYVPTKQPEDAGAGTVSFQNYCAPQPRSDLLAMHNPTCDIRTYSGGQSACHHMWSLLDSDQEIPWADQPLEYHLKFRFWVQEYNSSYHVPLRRTTWGIASPVEYDVPKCNSSIAGCSLQADGTWLHTITGTFEGSGKLAAAHFHCHAPTCLSISMYRCPKGTRVCNAETGKLLCKEEPSYGHDNSKPFQEPGYIFQPPCLWGSPEFGLEEPPSVDGYVLGSVKTSNATYGHHGEMAWQQMYYFTDADVPGQVNFI